MEERLDSNPGRLNARLPDVVVARALKAHHRAFIYDVIAPFPLRQHSDVIVHQAPDRHDVINPRGTLTDDDVNIYRATPDRRDVRMSNGETRRDDVEDLSSAGDVIMTDKLQISDVIAVRDSVSHRSVSGERFIFQRHSAYVKPAVGRLLGMDGKQTSQNGKSETDEVSRINRHAIGFRNISSEVTIGETSENQFSENIMRPFRKGVAKDLITNKTASVPIFFPKTNGGRLDTTALNFDNLQKNFWAKQEAREYIVVFSFCGERARKFAHRVLKVDRSVLLIVDFGCPHTNRTIKSEGNAKLKEEIGEVFGKTNDKMYQGKHFNSSAGSNGPVEQNFNSHKSKPSVTSRKSRSVRFKVVDSSRLTDASYANLLTNHRLVEVHVITSRHDFELANQRSPHTVGRLLRGYVAFLEKLCVKSNISIETIDFYYHLPREWVVDTGDPCANVNFQDKTNDKLDETGIPCGIEGSLNNPLNSPNQFDTPSLHGSENNQDELTNDKVQKMMYDNGVPVQANQSTILHNLNLLRPFEGRKPDKQFQNNKNLRDNVNSKQLPQRSRDSKNTVQYLEMWQSVSVSTSGREASRFKNTGEGLGGESESKMKLGRLKTVDKFRYNTKNYADVLLRSIQLITAAYSDLYHFGVNYIFRED